MPARSSCPFRRSSTICIVLHPGCHRRHPRSLARRAGRRDGRAEGHAAAAGRGGRRRDELSRAGRARGRETGPSRRSSSRRLKRRCTTTSSRSSARSSRGRERPRGMRAEQIRIGARDASQGAATRPGRGARDSAAPQTRAQARDDVLRGVGPGPLAPLRAGEPVKHESHAHRDCGGASAVALHHASDGRSERPAPHGTFTPARPWPWRP